MKKIYKSIILGLILSLLMLIILVNYKTNSNIPIINFIQDIALKINKMIVIPKIKTTNYKTIINNNKELQIEIEELKNLNNIKNILSKVKYINATVIVRNNLDFYNTITIDKGLKEGIKEGLCVVSGEYLIGKVIKANQHSAIIKLVTTNDKYFNISVYINNNIHAILSGYNKKTNKLSVNLIRSNLEIKKGDVVTTSGLGEIYPSGIKVGVVEDIKVKNDKITKEILIKSYKDYDKISFVSVLLREDL